MRFSTDVGVSEAEARLSASSETRGVTIDVMMGIVAGIALVLAILILASSLSAPATNAAMLPSLVTTA